MQVIINGAHTELQDVDSVAALLRHLGLEGRLAVEINGVIVPRSGFDLQTLKEGDRIEIVRAIGGG